MEPARERDLDGTFLLAQQIGPILAEGTKGNPRQVKRFLNSLFIRSAIAKARGFRDSVNQAVLAKLMLAERFQPDFYDHLAGQVQARSNEAGQVASDFNTPPQENSVTTCSVHRVPWRNG